MIPHERSLVERFEDRPFALIGVNSDGTDKPAGLVKYEQLAEEAGVSWRSFRDESVTPPISRTWKIDGWPTLFYLDHEGVIRHRNVVDPAAMERVLEQMIAAAEAAAK